MRDEVIANINSSRVMIKYLGLFFSFLLYSTYIHAQQLEIGIDDEWLKEHHGLNVGDTVPDIELGIVTNNYTGKHRFSEFRGKLIILDFWNTNCTSCFSLFPKMEELQKKFAGRIQIFIVNPGQTAQEIDSILKKRTKNAKPLLPDLPSITSAKKLWNLFPSRYVPHHVWIDGNGRVVLVGPSINTYSQKIEECLRGEKISFLKGENTNPRFDPYVPYSKIIGRSIDSQKYNSFLTPYNGEYAPLSGGVSQIIDTLNNVVRNTYVNQKGLNLILAAVPEIAEENQNKIIFTANFSNVSFLTKDTAIYTDDYIKSRPINNKITDNDFVRCRFCYEQIAPNRFSDHELSALMLKDLNAYFSKYGTEIIVEEEQVPCLVLKRRLGVDKLKTKYKEFGVQEYFQNGTKKMELRSVTFKETIRTALLNEIFSSSLSGGQIILIDETGYGNSLIDIVLPNGGEFHSLQELRKVLLSFNIEIVESDRPVKRVVIKKKSNNPA